MQCDMFWVGLFGADDDAMTSKNTGVTASTTMSSLGKACLELSKSIKGFRFSRQSPPDSKDAVSSSGQQQQPAAAAVTANTRPTTTTEDGSLSALLADDVTSGVSDGATGGGSSVTSTISRVIRSATNRVRAFPSSPGPSPHHQPHQQQIQACNAVNGHSSPAHVPLSPPTLSTPPPHPAASTRTTRARYIPPGGNTDVWHDEKFLLQFFRYFSAIELRVLAQVPRY